MKTRKHISCFILLLTLVFVFASGPAAVYAAEPEAFLTAPGEVSLDDTSSLNYTVRIANIAESNVFTIKLSYDSGKLDFSGVKPTLPASFSAWILDAKNDKASGALELVIVSGAAGETFSAGSSASLAIVQFTLKNTVRAGDTIRANLLSLKAASPVSESTYNAGVSGAAAVTLVTKTDDNDGNNNGGNNNGGNNNNGGYNSGVGLDMQQGDETMDTILDAESDTELDIETDEGPEGQPPGINITYDEDAPGATIAGGETPLDAGAFQGNNGELPPWVVILISGAAAFAAWLFTRKKEEENTERQ